MRCCSMETRIWTSKARSAGIATCGGSLRMHRSLHPEGYTGNGFNEPTRSS